MLGLLVLVISITTDLRIHLFMSEMLALADTAACFCSVNSISSSWICEGRRIDFFFGHAFGRQYSFLVEKHVYFSV